MFASRVAVAAAYLQVKHVGRGASEQLQGVSTELADVDENIVEKLKLTSNLGGIFLEVIKSLYLRRQLLKRQHICCNSDLS